jgi:hypothetical protein
MSQPNAASTLNQAFFKRLLVFPEWDDDGQRSARIERAELTEPYATLLADGLAEGVLAEAEALTAQAQLAENRLVGLTDRPRQTAPAAVSYFDEMVPLPGFEPGFPP